MILLLMSTSRSTQVHIWDWERIAQLAAAAASVVLLSGGAGIEVKEELNKEDLGLKLKINGNFT
jgi:Na+/H+ antiporter NhaC